MFYCQVCADTKGWPEGFSLSYGPCEICGKPRQCWSIPSKFLPIPKPSKKPDVRERHGYPDEDES